MKIYDIIGIMLLTAIVFFVGAVTGCTIRDDGAKTTTRHTAGER